MTKENPSISELNILERDKQIKELYSTGRYTTKDIHNMGFSNRFGGKLTIRSIQTIVSTCNNYRFGRTSHTPMLNPLEAIYISEHPNEVEEVLEAASKRFFLKRDRVDSKCKINDPNYIYARRKLRSIVFNRDEFKCNECGSSIGLEIHHKKPVSIYPELEFDPDNCITLCYDCHHP